MTLRIWGLASALWLSICATAASAQSISPTDGVSRNVVIREGPSTDAKPLGALLPGASLPVIEDVPYWYGVQLPGGAKGFVSKAWTEAAAASSDSKIAVHYIDVDQGAAALVELPAPCGAVLIDAGGYGKAADDHLIDYLNAFFKRRPDLGKRLAAVYITHSHLDHNTSLRRVVETFQVGRYIETGRMNGEMTKWMSERLTRSPAIEHVVITQAAVEAAGPLGISNARVDPLACSGVNPRIRILSGARVPVPGLTAGDLETENNHSMTIRIDYGASSFLWTGDMEKPALELLVARYKATNMLDTQVYEAGHHGAENGTIQSLVEAVTPELAIISVGRRGNSGAKTAYGYGHPRIEALELLEKSIVASRPVAQVFAATGKRQLQDHIESKAIYATGWDGDIVVTADAFGHLAVSLNP